MIKIKVGKISEAVVQRVGNKNNGDGIAFSSDLSHINDSEVYIQKLIKSKFKFDDFKHFKSIDSLEYNPVYRFVSNIFDDNLCLIKQANNLARHLYEHSIHHNIKIGEFSVLYFKDCQFDEKKVDAIGLFKSESIDTILKVIIESKSIGLKPMQGMSIRKLDKGCIIFNLEKLNGYKVAVVDNTNTRNDAHYWVNNFLNVTPCKDDFFHTQNLINITKGFTKESGLTLVEQVDMLNKSVHFFKEKKHFNIEEFTNEVINEPTIIHNFNQYKERYAKEHDLDILNDFTISKNAAKEGARSLKKVIKLDKNFDIHIHGDRNKIETGEDDKGKFYKVYYKKEM